MQCARTDALERTARRGEGMTIDSTIDPELRAGIFAHRYQLLERVGVDVLGDVWRATDGDGGPPVVIRRLDRSRGAPEAAIDRYLREMQAAQHLRDPMHVRVLHVGSDPMPFVVTEQLRCDALSGLLERNPRIVVSATLALVEQLSRALTEAHAAGLVHGAIDPTRVVFHADDDGRLHPKLVGLGLARLHAALPRARPFQELAYVAPEHLGRTSSRLRAAADVWAVGIIAFRCIAGVLPFEARSPAMLAGEARQVERLLRSIGSLDMRLLDMIASCVRHDQELRVSARALATRARLLARSFPGGLHEIAPWLQIPEEETIEQVADLDRAAELPSAPEAYARAQRASFGTPVIIPPPARPNEAEELVAHAPESERAVPVATRMSRRLSTSAAAAAVALVGIGVHVSWPSSPTHASTRSTVTGVWSSPSSLSGHAASADAPAAASASASVAEPTSFSPPSPVVPAMEVTDVDHEKRMH